MVQPMNEWITGVLMLFVRVLCCTAAQRAESIKRDVSRATDLPRFLLFFFLSFACFFHPVLRP